MTSRYLGIAASLCALVSTVPAGAQLLRVGGEFQVNSYTSNSQRYPAVDFSSNGTFVVAWGSAGQDGYAYGIFAQRWSSTGAKLGGEFQVNSYTDGYQQTNAVAVGSSGQFVIVWASGGQDGGDYGVFGKRYDSAGVAVGGEFQVNLVTENVQRLPAIGIATSGAFVVAWNSYDQDGSQFGIFARRYDSAGTPVGGEIAVNQYTDNGQRRPAIAVGADGRFVIAWASYGQDGQQYGVFMRRFDSSGAALEDDQQVNTYTPNSQDNPAVDLASDGSFVVVWNSYQGFDQGGIFGQRFASDGTPAGGEFAVNDYQTGNQGEPDVESAGAKGFVVSWTSFSEDGDKNGIFARRFDGSGAALGGDVQISTTTANNQSRSALGSSGAGKFVVVWMSEYQDGSDYGIFGQRLLALATLDVDGNGSIAPLTDGLLVLRFEFGFTGGTLITGAVDLAGCTRCDATSIEAYLNGLP